MELAGLRLDGNFADSPIGTWAYAKDVLLSRGFDEIENEPGNTSIGSLTSGTVVGRIAVPDTIIVFVWESNTGIIKRLNSNNTFTTLLSSAHFDLNPVANGVNRYIEGVYRYANNGDLIIAWTDGIQPPMLLNCSNVPTISSAADISKLYLFPQFTHAKFTNLNITSGGSLASAAYSLAMCYEIEPGVNTNFGYITNPIIIVKDDTFKKYKQFQGNGATEITNKAISITLTNLDSKYTAYKLAVIKRTEAGIECFISKSIYYNLSGTSSATSSKVVITDLDNYSPFDINQVVISNVAFDTIGTLTVSNKRLRVANVKYPTKVSLANMYDEVISKINLNWASDKSASLDNSKNSYKDSVFIFNNRHFRSDEVYAFYIGIRLKTGGFYGMYHIPGRVAVSTEATATTSIDGTNYITHKVSSLGDTLEGTSGSIKYGKFGYWQNENETYNNQYGAILGNSKVRHHRFPSGKNLKVHTGEYLTGTSELSYLDAFSFAPFPEIHTIAANTHKCHSNLDFSGGYVLKYGTYSKYLKVASAPPVTTNDVVYSKYVPNSIQIITATIRLTAVGCTTYAGNNPSINVTIKRVVPDLLSDTGLTVSETLLNVTQSIVGNGSITINTSFKTLLTLGEFLSIETTVMSGDVPTFMYNPVLPTIFYIYEGKTDGKVLGVRVQFDYTSITPSIKAELDKYCDGWELFYAKRTSDNMLMLDQCVTLVHGDGVRFHGFDSMAKLLNVQPTHIRADQEIDTANAISSLAITEVFNYNSLTTPLVSKVESIQYLPAFNSATSPLNTLSENAFYIKPTSGAFNRKLSNLIVIKNDTYSDFSQQELVSTGIYNLLSDTSSASPVLIYGGDAFINKYGFLTLMDFSSSKGVMVYYVPVENILNVGMRYDDDLDIHKFYPYIDLTLREGTPTDYKYITPMKEAGIGNYYIYADFVHMLNNLRQDHINTPVTSLINANIDTIFSSITQPDSDISTHWRIFKQLDKYVLGTQKGGIERLIGNDYIVYIKSTFSLYRGITIDSLAADNITVALKTTDIFDRRPEELMDADGNYIQSWNRDCIIITPYGLIVVDVLKGSIYQIADKANEISKIGIEDWLRRTLTSTMTFAAKNTIGNGVMLGYDDVYKRLLVTVKNSNTSTIANITLSFQFEKAVWVAFHTYVPNYYAWNANGLYQINANVLYKANNNNYGLVNGSYVDSIIDFIFAANQSERFLVQNVRWVTNIMLNNINYWDQTINKLMIYSKNLSTGEITLTKRSIGYNVSHELVQTGNILFKDGEWVYNDISDILSSPNVAVLDNNFSRVVASENLLKEWFEKSKFITKFIAVRMIYTNNANKKLRITNVNISAKNIL